jgi:hypothetical protein
MSSALRDGHLTRVKHLGPKFRPLRRVGFGSRSWLATAQGLFAPSVSRSRESTPAWTAQACQFDL